ncbi:MAG: PAS domain-containing protein [Lentisphaerae bacterium]|nr:PAS domain-containing protein [Lentisphaerota bacterium]
MPKKDFFHRVNERFDDFDSGSRQAFLLRLVRDRGFFEGVFNAVEEGILVIDLQLRIRYFNRAASELLALPQDLENLRVSQLLQGVDWRRILRSDSQEWDKVTRQELEILYPEPRFIQFYLVPLADDAKLAAVILRDVTESRRRQLNELESETVKAVSLLAAGVAHEIGNPLNSLYLNLQIVERELSENPQNSEQIEMLKECKHEVERLDSIIHGFLTAIRPGRPVFAPVDLEELVENVLNFMRSEIEARRVEVKCSWATRLPKISGDADQLKQCVYNIVRNAVQAMTNGGELTIFGSADREYLTLEFADTGSGITPEQLSTMFSAFHTTKSGGNGIGTMVIERICREHGVEFGIVSSAGRGSVFQLRFPLSGKRVRLLGSAN